MFSLDVTGRAPIYEQLCRGICGEIAMGLLKENSRLPAARVLAKELRINPNTVAKAYAALERDGVIYSVAGIGCFVAEQRSGVYKRLTGEFAQKALEAYRAGVPVEELRKVLEQVCSGEVSAAGEGVKDDD